MVFYGIPLPELMAKLLYSSSHLSETTKTNPLLTCGKDRLSMSLALPSNLDYLLRCEQQR